MSLRFEADDAAYMHQEGHNQSPHSILLHRMLRDLYLKERDYPNTIKICESGIRQVERVEKEWGRTLSK